MFERFTDRARRVVVLAQEEARMLAHNAIDTEHLLLGLVHEGEGVAAQALASLGVRLDLAREQVEGVTGRGMSEPSGHIPFTPRAKRVLELSLREALQLRHRSIGTEHILLGLLREGEGVATRVLEQLGASPERTWQEVARLLRDQLGQEAQTRSPAGPAVHQLDVLTDAVLAALVAARGEARRVGLDAVEVGPLFIGLLSIEGGAASRILGPELDAEQLRAALGQSAGQPSEATLLRLSARARAALGAVAGQRAGEAIGTGHLIRTLLREDAITALLRAAGADIGKAREAAARLDGDGGLP